MKICGYSEEVERIEYLWLSQACADHRGHVARADKFCAVVRNTVGSQIGTSFTSAFWRVEF